MKNKLLRKIVLLVMTAALALTAGFSLAESTSDYESLMPLMDLVSAASQYSSNGPESVPGAEGVLSASFTNAFILLGTRQCPEVGVTEAMLTDTDAQAALFSAIFAAELPALEQVPDVGETYRYVGFWPKTVKTLEDGTVQIMGEIYMADTSLQTMATADFTNVSWIDRAIYFFTADSTALNGYRLEGYSFGMDLSYEDEFQQYSEDVSVEYVSDLGFSFLYPAQFGDETLVEDGNGVTAALEDGSASFLANRAENTDHVTLADYMAGIEAATPGCTTNVNEIMQYATVFSVNENGCAVFDVYVVTDGYIYHTQLSCLENQLPQYSMYFSYLENSFVVSELYQG